ncbi:SH3 domain-containing protein [Novosphingobium album (ex Liu et al. 2023)]|uniref:SH3 domain-containing protein n=1 Tax=Novosphingobium album (ex Liu et al. 2023) TaxID=3031130 RepID=UPI0023B14688|nr:SH3 domain-containing protein [Novosphingobium album (ex Liu et al. 2023)]
MRGDLAHIRLAGRYFVPHYAVPMPHLARAGAVLLATEHDDAEVIAVLPEGSVFDVLDIAGAWAWGQFGEDGPVGYVALAGLEAITS